MTYGRPALDAFCRVMEAWVLHFCAIKVQIEPIRNIEEPRWAWHIGLDAESTAILNALWAGEQVEAGRMRRILALFRMEFAEREGDASRYRGPIYLPCARVGRKTTR